MRFIKRIAVLTIIIVNLNYICQAADTEQTDGLYEILFLGSSYFTQLPGLFADLADSAGKDYFIDQRVNPGIYLADHASSSLTEAKINQRDWDYVILQGVGSLTAYPDYYTHHPVLPALFTLRDKIINNCPTTKMVFCLPWAFEDGMTWVLGWTDTYADMQVHIYNNTLLYSDDVGFEISPVGWAWYTVLEEQNYPLHYLHMFDWNHPSPRGSYLLACAVFSTIYQESTTDIPYFGGLSTSDANYFQVVASNTVLDSLDLWNITPLSIKPIETSIPIKFHIYQNYPNPFNPVTTIRYELPHRSNVQLTIYDLLGGEVATLISETQDAGFKSVKWYATGISSGMYFYQISFGDQVQTKKLLLLK